MPYIERHQREKFRIFRREIPYIQNVGELNYALTIVMIDYIRQRGLSYQNINNVIGAVESAKAEFQRRIVANYEDSKIEPNGDIYNQGKEKSM